MKEDVGHESCVLDLIVIRGEEGVLWLDRLCEATIVWIEHGTGADYSMLVLWTVSLYLVTQGLVMFASVWLGKDEHGLGFLPFSV